MSMDIIEPVRRYAVRLVPIAPMIPVFLIGLPSKNWLAPVVSAFFAEAPVVPKSAKYVPVTLLPSNMLPIKLLLISVPKAASTNPAML